MLKTRPMVFIGIPFLLSCFIASFLISKQMCYVIAFLAITLILVGIIFRKKQTISVMLILVVCLFGFLSYFYKTISTKDKITPLANQEIRIKAVITDISVNERGTFCYNLNVLECGDKKAPQKFKTILYSQGEIDGDLYDTIYAKVLFNEIKSTATFNSNEFYKQEEIYVTAFLKEINHIFKYNKEPFIKKIKIWNERLCHKVDLLLDGDESALMKAMLLGDRADISEITSRSFTRSGMVHIISISGLHISILAGIFLFVLVNLKVSYRMCRIGTIVLVWIFVALTGFHISTIRSGIMLTVLLCGNLFGRPADNLNSLFLSGVLIVGANPFAIRSISFLMTFLATMGLILFGKKISTYLLFNLKINNSILKFIVNSIACTFSATLFLIPIFIIVFKGTSVVAPLANIVAVFLAPIILVLGIIMLMLSFNSLLLPFAKAIAQILSLILKMLINTANFFSEIPFSYVGLDYNYIKLWFIISVCILIIILIREKEKIKIASLICIISLFILSIVNQVSTINNINVETISTYNGQAVIITYRSKATVIEVKSDNYINSSIVSYLDNKNIYNITDFIILDKKTKSVNSFDYLVKVKNIQNIYIDENNPVNQYCEDYLSQNVNMFNFNSKDYLETTGNVKVKIEENFKERTVWLNIYNHLLCITSDEKIAKKTKCEFLFFSNKNVNSLEHFISKYVIILDECDNQILINKSNVFSAFNKKICMVFNRNSNYKLEQKR